MVQYFNEFLDVLNVYGLSKDQVMLCASSALAVKGLAENGDIDFIIHPQARDQLLKKYRKELEIFQSGTINFNKVVQSPRDKYKKFGFSDEMIFNTDSTVIYMGVRVVPIELELVRKISENREKDKKGIEYIESYMRDSNTFDYDLFGKCLQYANRPIPFVRRVVSWVLANGIKTIGFSSFIKILIKKIHIHLTKREYIPVVPTYSLKTQIESMIDTSLLLHNQYLGEVFSRYDIILRYLTIANFMEGDTSFNNYKFMQNERVGFSLPENFITLIDSFKNNGFKMKYPIPIDSKGHLLDGAHRLACALYFDIEKVPVQIEQWSSSIKFGFEWFERKGFEEEFLSVLEKTKREIFLKKGLYSPVIIWGAALHLISEIENSISSEYEIIQSGRLDLEEDYNNFIEELYNVDGLSYWKIALKQFLLSPYDKSVHFFFIDMKHQNFRMRADRAPLSDEGASLKAKIRSLYKEKVPECPSYSDIIIHTGDSPIQNREILKIIRKQKGLVSE